MSRARSRQVLLAQVFGFLSVVEYEQPSGVAPQPIADGPDGDCLVLSVFFGQVQLVGEKGVVGGEGGGLLGADPPDKVVVGGVAVGVFGGKLGLADALLPAKTAAMPIL